MGLNFFFSLAYEKRIYTYLEKLLKYSKNKPQELSVG